jgi:hypothetical protein
MANKYDARLDRDSAAAMLAKAGAATQAAEKAEGEEEKLDAEARTPSRNVIYEAVMLNAQPVRSTKSDDDSWGGAIATVVAKKIERHHRAAHRARHSGWASRAVTWRLALAATTFCGPPLTERRDLVQFGNPVFRLCQHFKLKAVELNT